MTVVVVGVVVVVGPGPGAIVVVAEDPPAVSEDEPPPAATAMPADAAAPPPITSTKGRMFRLLLGGKPATRSASNTRRTWLENSCGEGWILGSLRSASRNLPRASSSWLSSR